ncbi:P-loop containing nucleoside triphosphate hydrolase protein [Schizothecium vesticola]|uniref:P-loop containing nucleoside triphosphate hydrolase protein n=1 Tax=Schizothecium vesticola TaxID=314040 RepID=A0AA40F9H1_9PEZI|nr:P-loop containing nucleoside triphosphate hydrolase protein [Schizothecium vesticola]
MRQRKQEESLFTVLLLGVTGAGKSTFATHASGIALKIGDDIEPCTQDPLAVEFELDGRQIILIDTPGFDDDRRNDIEILRDVLKWIPSQPMLKSRSIDALILLHPVTRDMDGVTGGEKRRVELLQSLLGQDAHKRVTIATTMWESLEPGYAAQLEGELLHRKKGRMGKGGVWSGIVELGSAIDQHYNNKESAHKIIRDMIRRSNDMYRSKDASNGGALALGPSFFNKLLEQLEDQLHELRDRLFLHDREEEPELPYENDPRFGSQYKEWNEWRQEKQHLEDRIERCESQLKNLRTAIVWIGRAARFGRVMWASQVRLLSKLFT